MIQCSNLSPLSAARLNLLKIASYVMGIVQFWIVDDADLRGITGLGADEARSASCLDCRLVWKGQKRQIANATADVILSRYLPEILESTFFGIFYWRLMAVNARETCLPEVCQSRMLAPPMMRLVRTFNILPFVVILGRRDYETSAAILVIR